MASRTKDLETGVVRVSAKDADSALAVQARQDHVEQYHIGSLVSLQVFNGRGAVAGCGQIQACHSEKTSHEFTFVDVVLDHQRPAEKGRWLGHRWFNPLFQLLLEGQDFLFDLVQGGFQAYAVRTRAKLSAQQCQADRGDIEPVSNAVDHLVKRGHSATPRDRRLPCLLPLGAVEDFLEEDRHVGGRLNAETHHTLFGAHHLNRDIDARKQNLFLQTARDEEHARVSFPYSTAS